MDSKKVYCLDRVSTAGQVDKDDIPLNAKGSTLLAANIFCGHCGARLVLSTKLDALVDELVLQIFEQVKEASRADLLLMRQNKMADECSENLVRAKGRKASKRPKSKPFL